MISKIYSIGDDEFRDIVESCDTYSDIILKLGLKPNSSYTRNLLKKRMFSLGLGMKTHKRSGVYTVSDEEFKNIIKNSTSYTECLKILGLCPMGGASSRVLKRRIIELGCDTSHFKTKYVYKKGININKLLVKNSPYKGGTHNLKKRLLKLGLLDNKCYICGIHMWLNKPLSLQLDHINGNHTDNRLKNLRLLCPNCHSQTETYSGKKNKKI